MLKINPWINFNGNAQEAFDFYKSVFGGEVKKVLNDSGQMMFITLPIGNDNMLIANNVPEGMGEVSENENRSKIAASTESKEEAERIFNDLSSGGSVEVPMSEGMGSYMGMFRDKYGIEWIIQFSTN
ncbi:VOC family protein [Candidatus Dojkabacteria bacterium]|nr:VOC family protein [Candidatus Dojkabacteria bacterium]